MGWFFLVLFSVIGSSIANIYRRISMKHDKSDAVASAVIFQFIGAAIIGIVAFWHGFILPPFAKYPLNFMIQAICWGSATLFLFKTSQYLEASETAIITAASTVVTIVSAVLLLHEHFGFVYILGTILILFSIVFISKGSTKMRINRGMIYALLYCVFAGLGNTNDAFMLKYSHSDTLSLLSVGFFMPGIFLLAVQPKAISRLRPIFKPSHFSKVFLLTLFYALAAIAYFFAIAIGGQASQVSPISQSSIILTLLIGALFLSEKDHMYAKIISTVLVTIGVILLS